MSDTEGDPELTRLLTDLTRTLRELEREAAPERPPGPRLPTSRELSRFTSEVAIPGLILLLQTNVRALQLLQRAIRLADGREPSPGSTTAEVRTRAEAVGRASLSQLDDVLSELHSALEARPENDEAKELISRARRIREDITSELEDGALSEGGETAGDEHDDVVNIDIESELQSLKDDVDDRDEGPDDGSSTSGNGTEGADDGGTDGR